MDETLAQALEEAPRSTVESAPSDPSRASKEIFAASKRVDSDLAAKLTKAQREALCKSLVAAARNGKHDCGYNNTLFIALISISSTASALIRLGIARSIDEHRSLHPEEEHTSFGYGTHAVLTPLGEEVAFKLYQDRNGEEQIKLLIQNRDDRMTRVRAAREDRAAEIELADQKLALMEALTERISYEVYGNKIDSSDRRFFTRDIRLSFERAISQNRQVEARVFMGDDQLHSILTGVYELAQADAASGENKLERG